MKKLKKVFILPSSWYPTGLDRVKDLTAKLTQIKENYTQKKICQFSVSEKKTFLRGLFF